MQAVIKHAMFPLIIDLSIRPANSDLRSGAADDRAPRFIPRAATLPNPQRI